MALFQSTVVHKYLKAENQSILDEKWEAFQAHFHNPDIQANIRNAKEEQYQEGFLRDLFVNIFGYTLNPANDYNLTTELKNVKDSKKADGAIISRGHDPLVYDVKAIIELKGTDTTDLSKVETQAFGYKNNQSGCKYVITSNFEKLRFYIDNAIEHQEFNLFELTREQFDLLYLCLAFQNIKKDVPKKIKNDSHSQEDIITKQLYKDYSIFKRALFNNLVELNPDIEPLLLFKKSQKLLDRFLFLFFAEDRHLLPPNSVRLILKQWKQLKELDAYTPLYNRFLKYFGYLNTGHKGKQYDVYPYNGGLFKPDDILDKVNIDDDLLYEHTLKLSEYDFDSEVDVNILGHIFENSLNEIEEIQEKLSTIGHVTRGHDPITTRGHDPITTRGHDPLRKENKKNQDPLVISKRKKDGVFYTPKYITKYIVENTVGKLCEEQRENLNIVEEEFTLNRRTKTKKNLLEKLKTYRDWLLQLTICDPACGSGAFLNEALNYLIAEHRYLDELETKLMGGGFVFPNVENSILENNLFGVDINNESVEIAKLSLWLRTAQPNRKLNDLSSNIKCGNSLIDDPEVAGDKAFHWEKEFPQVFKEKHNKIYHITTAIHDSRTSARMKRYKVRERREMGTNPYPNVIYFTPEDDLLITKTIANIVKEDQLKLLAYNICADHIHLLLSCELEEVPKIMQKIKSITAKKVNETRSAEFTRGHDPLRKDAHITRGHDQKGTTRGHDKRGTTRGHDKRGTTRGHDPLRKGSNTNKPLWQQKYSAPKEVTSQAQLQNTLKYIQNNRSKHELPEHSNDINKIINNMCCTAEEAFASDYKGGFDVVIGNPPYGIIMNDNEQDYYSKHYPLTNYKINLYVLFIERMLQIFNKGIIHFIIPKSLLFNTFYKKIREALLNQTQINEIHTITEKVFKDAEVGSSLLLNFEIKNNVSNDNLLRLRESKTSEIFISGIGTIKNVKSQKYFFSIQNFEISIIDKNKESIQQKLLKLEPLKTYYKLKNGLNPGNIKHILISPIKETKKHKPIIWGKDISKYCINWSGDFINYDENIKNKITIEDIKSKSGMNKQSRIDFALRSSELFENKKIVVRKTSDKLIASIDTENHYFDTLIHGIYESSNGFSLEALLAILNSKPATVFYRILHDIKGKVFAKISLNNLASFPMPKISDEIDKKFLVLTNQMLSLNKNLQEVSSKFKRTIERKINPNGHDHLKLGKKLEQWYELNFADFVKEFNKKQKSKGFKPLGLNEEAEWEDYFLAEQQKAMELKTQIDQTDKNIDQMVYELYGLTEEEIEIVENS